MIKTDKGHLILLLLTLMFNGVKAQNVDNDTITVQSRDSLIILDEINVVAYRVSGRLHNLPGSISVLTGEGLRLSDGTNMATTLNMMPGVTMQTGTFMTNRIVIRGMGSRTPYNTNRIRAYLNEIPLTTADGVSTPEEIDILSIDKIEVIKGPASALYGSGLGGSINMYTPEHSDNQVKLSAQYGSFNTRKTHLSGSFNKGKISLWGSIGHLGSDGYRENSQFKRTSILATARYKQSDWSVNATLMFIGSDGGIPSSLGKTMYENSPEAAAQNWKAIGGFKRYNKGLTAISISNNITKQITNQIIIFGKLNDSYEKRPFNNLDDRSLSGGLRYRLNYHTDKTDWVVGAEWISEQYEWKLEQNNSLLNENRENREQANLFSTVHFHPGSKINISLAGALNRVGYRLTDRYISNGDQSGKRTFPVIFSPRIGINYAPGDRLALYGSIGQGFSLPSPEETLLPEGDVNPDLKPEQGMQYEAGTRLNLFGKSVEIDASLYWIELNNLLLTKRITEDIFTGQNAGKTRHQGVEILLRMRLFEYRRFPGRLILNSSYTHSFNRFIDFTDDGNNYDGKFLPGIPRQSMQLQIKWNAHKLLELVSHLQYSGDQFINDSNTLTNPGYFLINIKVTSEINFKKAGPVYLYAGLNNLTDTKYASMLIVNALGFNNTEPRYYYPGLPRNGYAGIRFRF